MAKLDFLYGYKQTSCNNCCREYIEFLNTNAFLE